MNRGCGDLRRRKSCNFRPRTFGPAHAGTTRSPPILRNRPGTIPGATPISRANVSIASALRDGSPMRRASAVHPCGAGTNPTATPTSAHMPVRAGPNASGSGGLVGCCGCGGWGCGLGALGSPGRVVVAGGASWRGQGGVGEISFGMVQYSRQCRENCKRLKSRRLGCVWGDLRRRNSANGDGGRRLP